MVKAPGIKGLALLERITGWLISQGGQVALCRPLSGPPLWTAMLRRMAGQQGREQAFQAAGPPELCPTGHLTVVDPLPLATSSGENLKPMGNAPAWKSRDTIPLGEKQQTSPNWRLFFKKGDQFSSKLTRLQKTRKDWEMVTDQRRLKFCD